MVTLRCVTFRVVINAIILANTSPFSFVPKTKQNVGQSSKNQAKQTRNTANINSNKKRSKTSQINSYNVVNNKIKTKTLSVPTTSINNKDSKVRN